MRSVHTSIITLAISFLLSACGGGGGASVSDQGARIEIAGAGIKGPLAFADTRIYKLDPAFPQFYDPNNPISTAITNDAAQISGLSVPRDVAPPYILTIGGEHAIDLNTSKSPVISTLVTVITENMLAENRPIYMTPLTTLAFHMAIYGTSASASAADFVQAMENAAAQASIVFAVSDTISVDIFSSPLVINDNTDTLPEQEEAVHHRAALEAFAAKVHTLSVSLGNVSSDEVIKRLAQDLQSDGVIDNTADGSTVGGIDVSVMLQDPMDLIIPNTEYSIAEITTLMDEERVLIGTDRGPTFYKDSIALVTSSTANGNSTGSTSPATTTSYGAENTPPLVATNITPRDYLLYADFENRSIGAYAESAIRTDFQVNMNGYNDSNWLVQHMDIVADPASSGRDNVLRVKRFANRGWAGPNGGGMQFRADFAWVDDVYFAFDMYLAPDHEYMKQMKNPGLMFSTYDDVGHPDFNTYPTTESLKTFVYTVSSDGNSAWGRGDGALSTYFYDKNTISGNEFWDRSSPTFAVGSNTSTGGNQYHQPTGRWITVELRMKMNTVGSNNGLSEVWVTDSGLNGGAATKVSSHNHKWRINSAVGIDGISMSNFYGGNGDDRDNQPSRDQYHYYDNFRVSTSPITH